MERNRILIAEEGKGVPDGLMTNLQIVVYEQLSSATARRN